MKKSELTIEPDDNSDLWDDRRPKKVKRKPTRNHEPTKKTKVGTVGAFPKVNPGEEKVFQC